MRFTSKQIRAIVRGEITQARLKPSAGGRLPIGKSISVQRVDGEGRVHPTVHRIIIIDVRDQTLAQLLFEDARAEGHKTTQDALEAWKSPTGRISYGRSTRVVTFALDVRERPLLLRATGQALRPGQLDTVEHERGYTDNPRDAMQGELESIPLDVLETYAKYARARDQERRRAPGREYVDVIQSGVAGLREHASGEGFDKGIKRNLRVVEHHLSAIERKLAG